MGFVATAALAGICLLWAADELNLEALGAVVAFGLLAVWMIDAESFIEALLAFADYIGAEAQEPFVDWLNGAQERLLPQP